MATDRSHRRYKEAKKRLFARAKASDAACVLCGQPIDWQAGPNDNMGPSANHITPVSKAGANGLFGRLEIMHRICNSRLQNKTKDEYLAALPEDVKPTLVW